MITIYTNGSISINGRATGLSVRQGSKGTEVYTPERARYNDKGQYIGTQAYKLHTMPHRRYCLSHAEGSGQSPGLNQFEADLQALL